MSDRPDPVPPVAPGPAPVPPVSDRPGRVPPPLLETLVQDPLDPGYLRAAERRASTGQAPSTAAARTWLLAGTVVTGLLLAVAFQTTRANSPGVDQARQGLLADLTQAQAAESGLEQSVSALNDEVRSAQASAGGNARSTLTSLEQMNALLAVTGPGLRITLNDPDAATGNGAVQDKDIQLLVNGLWSSGAEAVAIGGVRLRVTSAIRQAGGAILVDNRPVLWPMTIEAIGDPDTIQQQFVSTPGFGRFSSFVQLYDVTFTVAVVGDLSLPAAAAIDSRYLGSPASNTPSAALSTDSPEPSPAVGSAPPATTR